MKYIKAKDGIKKVFRKLKDGFYLVKVSKYKYYHYYPDCEVADTIEDLCDEFICLENKMMFSDLETITSSCNLKDLTIYGAIWTDKGIIYVAKLNKKGKLELL